MAKGTQRASNVDYPRFFERGESFLFASRLTRMLDCEGMKAAAFAYVTNVTFATEVYFKVLRHIEQGDTHLNTHNLITLFEDLPQYLQDRIEHFWTRENNKLNWSANNAQAPQSVMECLKASAMGFVDFRYTTDADLAFYIDQLPYVLRWAILAKRPDWKPVMGTPYSTIDPHYRLVRFKREVSAHFVWPPSASIDFE